MGNGISTVVATLPPDTERLQRRLQRVTEHRNALWRHWMEAEADEQQERTDHLHTLAKASQMERELVQLRTSYEARGAELDRMIGAYEAKLAEVERMTGDLRAAEREVRRSGEREIAAGLRHAGAIEEAQRVECEAWRLATGCLTPEHASSALTLKDSATQGVTRSDLLELVAAHAYHEDRTGQFDFDEWRNACAILFGEKQPGTVTATTLHHAAANFRERKRTTAPEAPPATTPHRFIAVPASQVNGRPAESAGREDIAHSLAEGRNEEPADFCDDFDRFGARDAKAWPWAVVDTQPPPAEATTEEPTAPPEPVDF
jgi:hypothetical protein